MRMLTLLLALLMTAGCSGCVSVPSHDQLRATALRLEFAGGGVCSGTAIKPDVLMTAQHCLSGTLLAVNDQPVKVVGIGKDGNDLATIKVEGLTFKAIAKIGPALAQGDRVRWFGNPALLPNIYREGYVVRAQTDGVLIDAQAFGGDSGAGVFDSHGRVVGVITGGYAYVNRRSGGVFQLVLVYPMEKA